MINEIKEMLARGEVVELECVDEKGFLRREQTRDANEAILGQEVMTVEFITQRQDLHLRGVLFGHGNLIANNEIRHFRIKRPSPTFKNLVDVAVKAVEDKLIIISCLTDWQLQFVRGSDTRYIVSHDSGRIKREMDFINSLYTETFVIESEDDINKIKWVVAEAKLSNGKDIPLDVLDGSLDPYYTFCLLKGATVTQNRGK